MAFILKDRVQETATANTTVSFTLSGAATGYQSFSAIGDTNSTYYGATDGTNWEVGVGTYTLSTTTLSRDTILSSSNSGSAVTFSGTVTVWCDYPASKSVSTDYTNALGVVTPNTGTFTTLTAQTEVLKGTGENLFTQSNTFTNATAWTPSGVTVTGGQSDPVGGTSATALGFSAQYQQLRQNQYTAITGVQYTFTIWAQVASGTRTLTLVDNASNILGTFTATTTWTKYSITFTALSNNTLVIQDRNASGFVTVNIYQSQLEIGSTVGTYIPTTTTAVYGTPSLSFSGVAGLGLQSDGSLYVSPAGTGALQAQATTSSATGGNARGANAVDWQTSRASAGQVASGQYSVVGGGVNNTASGFSSVSTGSGNIANNLYSSVLSGNTNTASGYAAVIAGGNTNTAAGYYNFIGTGWTNSGTSGSAVTTQVGATTISSTAVTLTGSNASIKVGQYITGTGISAQTYVAAISGTSLTLSQNAASSQASTTLSFYTPHGVVVGGGNNQATGSYSFIGGGGDAGTAANRNTASGDWSFVGGGQQNTASGIASVIAGGGFFASNTASGAASVIAGGAGNTASSSYGTVLGGRSGTANANNSTIVGGYFGTARAIVGNTIFSSQSNALSGASGNCQGGLLVLARQTTDATPTVLVSDTNAAGTTNQVILPNNSAYYFKARVISGVTGAGNTKAWTLEGAIKRGANAASTAIVGTVTTTVVAADAGASTWTVTATADTTNGGLAITFTGQAGTTIRTVCKIETAEMTY